MEARSTSGLLGQNLRGIMPFFLYLKLYSKGDKNILFTFVNVAQYLDRRKMWGRVGGSSTQYQFLTILIFSLKFRAMTLIRQVIRKQKSNWYIF